MATASDSPTVDEEGVHEHPGGGEPVGGHADDVGTDDAHAAHDDHAHGHDGHDDHGSGGDAWVLIPIGLGLLIGLLLALYFGLGSGASPLN
ncbi:MAG: hypothetical protein JWO77_45 [Ilumatobacteraceae bacterium]|nr:hypothetical protein [Ilumatobacteraceae bacterium]